MRRVRGTGEEIEALEGAVMTKKVLALGEVLVGGAIILGLAVILPAGCSSDRDRDWAMTSAVVRDDLGKTGIYYLPTWSIETDSGEVRPIVFCNLPPIWKGMHGDFYFTHHTRDLDFPPCEELIMVKRDFKELKTR
jgi:hypothetical protein